MDPQICRKGPAEGDAMRRYPYYTQDPASCPYYDDLSYCPTVQLNGQCDIDCKAVVKITSIEDEKNFAEWLDENGYGEDEE